MSYSPYAAPNTPIASSKRAKTSSVKKDGLQSPAISKKLYATESDNTDNNDSKIVNSKRKADSSSSSSSIPKAPPMSPKLFSPALKRDDNSNNLSQSSIRDTDDLEIQSPEDDRNDTNMNNRNKLQEEEEEAAAAAAEDEVEEEEFNPYLFIASLPPHDTVTIPGKICLPPQAAGLSGLTTLALDLDETLVHCTIEPTDKYDMSFPVTFNGAFYQVYVRKRPYLDYFLETVSKDFEVVIFTASQKVYADVLLDMLDPEKKFIHHRLFREACLLVHGNYLKDLQVLGRDLSKTVLIDNSPHAYGYQVNNGIPIESWFDDDRDQELLKLAGFLRQVQGVEDVRPILRNHFKTYRLINNNAI